MSISETHSTENGFEYGRPKQPSSGTLFDEVYRGQREEIFKPTQHNRLDDLIEELGCSRIEKLQGRRQEARDSLTPTAALDLLAHDCDEVVKYFVAGNKMTRPSTLQELAIVGSEQIKANVAANPSVTMDVLDHLSMNMSPWVRAAVANNEKTPVELLARLSEDKAPIVRRAVIGNKSVSTELLLKLATDVDSSVRFPAIERLEDLRQGLCGNGAIFSGSVFTPHRRGRIWE